MDQSGIRFSEKWERRHGKWAIEFYAHQGEGQKEIACLIGYNALLDYFGVSAPVDSWPSAAEILFIEHRDRIHKVAERMISGGRTNKDGGISIQVAECREYNL